MTATQPAGGQQAAAPWAASSPKRSSISASPRSISAIIRCAERSCSATLDDRPSIVVPPTETIVVIVPSSSERYLSTWLFADVSAESDSIDDLIPSAAPATAGNWVASRVTELPWMNFRREGFEVMGVGLQVRDYQRRRRICPLRQAVVVNQPVT